MGVTDCSTLRCAHCCCISLLLRRRVSLRLRRRIPHALADIARAVLCAVVVAVEKRPADGVVDEVAARLLVVEIATTAHHLCQVCGPGFAWVPIRAVTAAMTFRMRLTVTCGIERSPAVALAAGRSPLPVHI
eukprot:5726745-Prymnesium_polylepis.1